MAPIVLTVEIARSPKEVFAYATDPNLFAEWQADVVKVTGAADGPLRVGSRFTTTRRIGKVERTMTQEIVRIDEPARWAAHGVSGPVQADASLDVKPAGPGSTATFTFDFHGRGPGVLLVPMIRRMTSRRAPVSIRRLKELLEKSE